MSKKMKVLMYNPKTGEVIATQADPNGKVYQGYENKGFIAIGHADGFNLYVAGLQQCYLDHLELMRLDKPCDKEKLVEKVVEQIKQDILGGDVEAIEELLMYTPIQFLVGYLPEGQG